MIIGLTGQMASGKSTVVEALMKWGFKHITLSDAIREEADRRSIPQKRENLMAIGQDLRSEHGAGVLAERALVKAREAGGDKWLIDGIRNPAEVDVLRADPSFVLIANTAPEDLIIQRILSRKRSDDTLNEDSIRSKLRRELGEGEPADGQQVQKCIDLADYTFENVMVIDDVEEAFKKLYDRITASGKY